MIIRENLIKELEQRGELAVKSACLNGEYKSPAYEIVLAWLDAKSSARSEAREDESLSIARKALSSARSANTIAKIAIIIAIIAIVAPIVLAWISKK
jgi:hypothetical protein